MFKIKRPKKDTTILSDEPCENRGLDEVLHLKVEADELPSSPTCASSFLDAQNSDFTNNYPPSNFLDIPNPTAQDLIDYFYPEVSSLRAQKSRALLKWDLSDWITLTSNFSSGSGVEPTDYDVFLKMFHTQSQKLPLKYQIQFFPLANNHSNFGAGFEQGTGRSADPRKQGASWIFKDIIQNRRWTKPGGDVVKKNQDGDKVYAFQNFNFDDPDINVSIKQVFDYWKENENNGLLVKFEDQVEKLQTSNFSPGSLREPAELFFFGSLSHTIYKPELLLGFDDHEWNTSGADMLTYDESLKITLSDLENEYFEGEQTRIRVNVTKKYQTRKFINIDDYVTDKRTPKFLPEGSLKYSVVDATANKTIIPYSKYSQLSFDPNGYYFNLDLTNFYPERVYEIRFKYDDPVEDFEEIYDNKHKFKVKKQ